MFEMRIKVTKTFFYLKMFIKEKVSVFPLINYVHETRYTQKSFPYNMYNCTLYTDCTSVQSGIKSCLML